MYWIEKDFAFSASHVLHGLPEGHPCGRLHGHNYIVRVTLGGRTLDETGFVEDYGRLADVKEYIDLHLDHRHLNDILQQPSAEHLARALYATFVQAHPSLVRVSVSETPKTWATYER